MVKELKFKCPECGCSDLISIETSKEIYFIKSISDDPIEPIIYQEKTETIDHWKERFQCDECGNAFELSEEEMRDWVKKNCPQE